MMVMDIISSNYSRIFPNRFFRAQINLGTLVRNEQAIQILVSALVYPEIISGKLKPVVTVDNGFSIPENFHKRIFTAIADIIKSNPMNYFLTESLNILPTFIEQLDKFGLSVQVNNSVEYLPFHFSD